MIISRSLVNDIKVVNGFNATAISTDAVHTGLAIDFSGIANNGAEIGFLLRVDAHSTGDVKIQDVQFSSVEDFSSDVETVGSDHIIHFIKGDTVSDVDALSQTLINTANTVKKLGLHIPVVNKQYMRIRLISANTANLTASVMIVMTQGRTPVNQ